MANGGRRPGAGRKKGAKTKRTQEIAAKAVEAGVTPLEFMLNVMRDAKADFHDRFTAAVQAAPYIHPKLTSTNLSGDIKVSQFSDEQLAVIRAALAAAATVGSQGS